MTDLQTSLIVSTYNWPQALRLCLQSILHQSVLPNEIIIADDGSTSDTQALIASMQKDSPVPIIHVWHEDAGFRLAEIRNKAMARCSNPYIIQIDGDLILHKDFIKDHIHFARPQSFVSGSRVIIGKALSQQLLTGQNWQFNLFKPGLHNRLNGVRLPILSSWKENHRQNDIIYVRGCNMAFWREDLLRVNGYNEEIKGWGREDNEIACRLNNINVKKRILKFAGICFHLYHPQQSRSSVEQNDEILYRTIREKRIRCNKGIDQYLKG